MTVALRLGDRLPVGALLCAVASAAFAACSPRATADPRAASAAPDTAGLLVATTTVRAPLQLPAQLYVEHDAAVVARSAGVVDSVVADLGSRVSDGMTLARLENVDQELAVAQAEPAAMRAVEDVDPVAAQGILGIQRQVGRTAGVADGLVDQRRIRGRHGDLAGSPVA